MSRAPSPEGHGYRPEIDGIRAIAVLSVVLFHFGAPGLGGGFVGVDVFFVLSGFLIGGQLWSERRRTGRVALGAFYVRRFRRLAPAYFTMAAVTGLVAWFVLLPFEFREFGKALIAATMYLSNVLFFRSAGYFDTAAEEKALLHTWSLSVEEQFYLFLPIFLMLLARWPRVFVWALTGLAMASLAACIALTPQHPTATFYLFPFRAWELLAGVLLAIWGHGRAGQMSAHPILSWVGLGLVAASITMIQPGTDFPGSLALAPVLGTLLLLANGQNDNPVNRILSHPVPVFFGLISYSLYLWHWPVLTLATYWHAAPLTLLQAALWLGVSGALAILSWALIERPVRQSRRITARMLVIGTGLSSGALMAFGALLYLRDGVPDRFAPNVRMHIDASADFLQDFSRCHWPDQGPLAGVELCPIGPPGDAPKVLIWGDSHVRAMFAGLQAAADQAGQPAWVIWTAGCPPAFGLEKSESAATPAEDAHCSHVNANIETALDKMPGFDAILLIGRWNYYTTGTGIGLDAHNTIQVRAVGDAPDASQPQIMARAWGQTINRLLDATDHIFVLRQVPEIPGYDSRATAQHLAHSAKSAPLENSASVPRDQAARRSFAAEAPLLDLAETGAITWIDTWPHFCDAERCSATSQGRARYFDNNHITNQTARDLAPLIAPVFADEGAGS